MKMPTLEEIQAGTDTMQVAKCLTVGQRHSGNSRTFWQPYYGVMLYTESCFPSNPFKPSTESWWADYNVPLEEAKEVKKQYGEKVQYEEAWYAEDGSQMLFFLELNDLLKWLYDTKRFPFQQKKGKAK